MLLTELGPTATDYNDPVLVGLMDPESAPFKIHYWVVAYNDVGSGPMQSSPLVFPEHRDETDWMWTSVLIGLVMMTVAMLSFIIIRSRNRHK